MEIPEEGDAHIAISAASELVGVPESTLRYWIRTGKLPTVAGNRKKLVRKSDVLRAAELAGRMAGNVQPISNRPDGNDDTKPVNVANPGTQPTAKYQLDVAGKWVPSSSVPPTAMSQLDAIRDAWLEPLVAQIREQAEEIGELRAKLIATVERTTAAESELEREHAQRHADAEQASQLVGLEQRMTALERQTSSSAGDQLPADSPGEPVREAMLPGTIQEEPSSPWRRMVQKLSDWFGDD